jgi:hypothetical protein
VQPSYLHRRRRETQATAAARARGVARERFDQRRRRRRGERGSKHPKIGPALAERSLELAAVAAVAQMRAQLARAQHTPSRSEIERQTASQSISRPFEKSCSATRAS